MYERCCSSGYAVRSCAALALRAMQLHQWHLYRAGQVGGDMRSFSREGGMNHSEDQDRDQDEDGGR